mmetsp:Transcript_20217/g.53957  ORF Transcript_20217/g.53957 Transcript_20217/m.53957 type:complete len:202 (+) Transcript_20217:1029-1634(+)
MHLDKGSDLSGAVHIAVEVGNLLIKRKADTDPGWSQATQTIALDHLRGGAEAKHDVLNLRRNSTKRIHVRVLGENTNDDRAVLRLEELNGLHIVQAHHSITCSFERPRHDTLSRAPSRVLLATSIDEELESGVPSHTMIFGYLGLHRGIHSGKRDLLQVLELLCRGSVLGSELLAVTAPGSEELHQDDPVLGDRVVKIRRI